MAFKDIQILRMNYLRGPNIWTYRPIIEALIDLGEMEDHPSNKIDGFNDRINGWLPGLVEHHCGVGHRGGFLTRLVGGTWMGHIMEHVSIELQLLAGARAEFGKAREISKRGIYKVVFRTEHEELGRESFLAARELVMAAANNKPFDIDGTVQRLKKIADLRCLGPSTACIVDAAVERKTPFIRLTEGNLVQLGHGAAQRRIWTAETDRTSAIAEGISKDKDMTKRLLATCGIPVPEGQIVESPEQAWEAAQDIGVPVCVKPGDGNRARGVSLDLREKADIEAAYAIALEQGSEVIVEKFIQGLEHRLLVVGDRLVAASRGETASVTGDGQHTVRELVNRQINSDPRRGSDGSLPLETVRLRQGSPEVLELKRQGLTPDSVPEAGRTVLVKRTGNMTTDITDIVHPDVAQQAILAAKIVGLDIAGVDVVTPDITQPLAKAGGVVVEVNAGPSLLMHLNPAVGQARPVGAAIAEHLIPAAENGRIPLVGIMGDGDTTASAKLTAWLLHIKGLHTGLACADGLYLDQRRLQATRAMDFEQAQRLLINRSVEADACPTRPSRTSVEAPTPDSWPPTTRTRSTTCSHAPRPSSSPCLATTAPPPTPPCASHPATPQAPTSTDPAPACVSATPTSTAPSLADPTPRAARATDAASPWHAPRPRPSSVASEDSPRRSRSPVWPSRRPCPASRSAFRGP